MKTEIKATYIAAAAGIIGIVLGIAIQRLWPEPKRNSPEIRTAAVHVESSEYTSAIKISLYNSGDKSAAVNGVTLKIEKRWVICSVKQTTSSITVSGSYDLVLPATKLTPFDISTDGVAHGLPPDEFDALLLNVKYDPPDKTNVTVYLASIVVHCDGHPDVDGGKIVFSNLQGDLVNLAGTEGWAESENEATALFDEIVKRPANLIPSPVKIQIDNRNDAKEIRELLDSSKQIVVQSDIVQTLFEALMVKPDKSMMIHQLPK